MESRLTQHFNRFGSRIDAQEIGSRTATLRAMLTTLRIRSTRPQPAHRLTLSQQTINSTTINNQPTTKTPIQFQHLQLAPEVSYMISRLARRASISSSIRTRTRCRSSISSCICSTSNTTEPEHKLIMLTLWHNKLNTLHSPIKVRQTNTSSFFFSRHNSTTDLVHFRPKQTLLEPVRG